MIVLETQDGYAGKQTYGMSTGAGDEVANLPTKDVPQGSVCMDYTTKEVYFFDGKSWN